MSSLLSYLRPFERPQGNRRADDGRKSERKPAGTERSAGVSQVSRCLPPAERHLEGKVVRGEEGGEGGGGHMLAFECYCRPQGLGNKSQPSIITVKDNLIYLLPCFIISAIFSVNVIVLNC